MVEGIHEFSVGQLACVAVNDGCAFPDLERVRTIYPDIPEDELRTALDSLPEGGGAFCYNTLYLKNARLLVDTGHGPTSEQHGHMLRRLAQVGVAPEDVAVIFISHAHGDHVGGLTDAEGKRIFPNARYVMGQREWQYWMHEAEGMPEDYLTSIRRKLNSMEGRLALVEPGDEIVPGVTAVEAYGHTPGHMGLILESGGEKLLHLVDALHMLIQVMDPNKSPRFDTLKELSPVTRRRLLQQAVDENLLVYAYHLPFPPLGRVTVAGSGFAWQPV